MNLTRRETLAGAAACMARATPLAAVPGVAARRPALVALNHLEVCDATGEAVACVRAYLMLFLAPKVRPYSKERETACFLGIYADLLNGSAIQAAHIEGLSADRLAEIDGLPDTEHAGFDENFCRWVDDAVSEIVDADWFPMPNALGRARRLAKTLDDEAIRLHRLDRDAEALNLCDEVVRIFGANSPEGVRARVKKALWLNVWIDDLGSKEAA